MGHAREKSLKLASKLLAVRKGLGLSQNRLVALLGPVNTLYREDISKFERGLREPPLPTLLRYARLANLSTDDLIDDEVDLVVNIASGEIGVSGKNRTENPGKKSE